MSIIQEALKKAEVVNSKTETIAASEPVIKKLQENGAPVRAAAKRLTKSRLSPVFIIAPAALAAVMIAAFLVFNGHVPVKNESPQVSAGNVSSSRQEVIPKTPALAPKEAPAVAAAAKTIRDTPKFTLSGIMYLESSPKAIVNGSVVTQGDIIGGATVKKINKSAVILSYEDVEILLDLNE
jgi:hypothetical protein